jgi:hypothetical protein
VDYWQVIVIPFHTRNHVSSALTGSDVKFIVTMGIGTTAPAERLQIADGDVYLSDVEAGVIMKSPDGQCWRMTVSNAGAPVFTSVACP